MAGVQKHIQNQRIAAHKAHGQRVYISGLDGQHSLEMGVAYHYRGHYLYAYPAGNPIEPVPFSTKKGINIVGTVHELAPIYDPNVADLVPESSIAALTKSQQHVFKEQQDVEREARRHISQAFQPVDETMEENDTQMPVIVRPDSHALQSTHSRMSDSRSTPLIASQVSSCASTRCGSQASLPALSVHGACSNIGHPASSQALCSHESSLQAGDSKRAYEAATYYLPKQFTGGPSLMANPQLPCAMSSPNNLESMAAADPMCLLLQRFASDPPGLVDPEFPAFSCVESHGPLASMAQSVVGQDYGKPPLATGPGIQLYSPDKPHLARSISRVGSHASLADLSSQDAQNTFAQQMSSCLVGLPPSTRAGSRPSMPAIGAHSCPEPSLEVGAGPHVFSRGPSSLVTATPPLSPSSSPNLHTALADLTIYDGTYYREGGQATAGPSLLRSQRSQPSLPSMARKVSQEVKPGEGYVFGSTLTPLNACVPPDYSKPRSFTPHDRALYLADSAPGSRLPSVAPSRAVSPDKYMNAQAQYNMRSYGSTSHLCQPLEQSVPSSWSPYMAPLRDISPETRFSTLAQQNIPSSLRHVNSSSRAPSKAPSRHTSPEKYFASLNGPAILRHSASNLRLNQLIDEEGRGRASGLMDEVMDGSSEPWTHIHPTGIPFSRPDSPSNTLTHIISPPNSRNKPIGTGRPRRASIILNQAHNLKTSPLTTEPTENQLGLGSVGVLSVRVPKCPIHSEDCDGVSVSETWKTNKALKRGGFAAPYPILQGEGEEKRPMIDWLGLLRDERDGLVSGRRLV